MSAAGTDTAAVVVDVVVLVMLLVVVVSLVMGSQVKLPQTDVQSWSPSHDVSVHDVTDSATHHVTTT